MDESNTENNESSFDHKINEIFSSIPEVIEDERTPPWAIFIVGAFKGLCVELRKMNDGFSKRIDQLEVKNSINEAIIKSLEEKLKSKSTELEIMIDDNSQYSRRNCLLLHGVPENDNENIDKILHETLNDEATLDLGISVVDVIDRAHRLGKPSKGRVTRNNKPKVRPIIIKFTSYRTRRAVFSSKKHLKGTGVVITESLTHRRYKLLQAAQEKYGFKSTWSSDGKIMAYVNNTYIYINNSDDLK